MLKRKNAPARFEKAFEHVPSHIWTVFEEPKELYNFIDGQTPSQTSLVHSSLPYAPHP
jgi:hypothetical protein